MINLRYFTFEEFKRASHPNDIPACFESNVKQVLGVVDELRHRYGKPLYILQGGAYRGVEFNAKVGGARSSRHLFGEAVDIRPRPSSMEEIEKLYTILEDMVQDGSLENLAKSSKLGIGRYFRNEASFLHIDVRKGLPARWEEDTFRKLNKPDEDKE